jgi:hypothetical protein
VDQVRHLRAPALLLCLAAGCHRGGNATPTPTPTPAPREATFVQIDVAVGPGTTIDQLTKGLLLANGSVWRPDPAGAKELAAALPPITADVYSDEGFVSIAFSGAAARYRSGDDLVRFLTAVATPKESAGGALYLMDDQSGETANVAAVAGHDLAEAAMALVDVWAPDLDLDYAQGASEDPAVPTRAALVEKLRAKGGLEGRIRRFPGAKIDSTPDRVVVRFPAEGDQTRELASQIAEQDLAGAAAPRVVNTNGG